MLKGRLHQKPRRRWENNIKTDLVYVQIEMQFELLYPN